MKFHSNDSFPDLMVGRWAVPTAGFMWRADLRSVDPAGPGTGPWLVPAADRPVVAYDLLGATTLPALIADLLDDPSPNQRAGGSTFQQRVLRFAKRWGWLGSPASVYPLDGGQALLAEPLSLWIDTARDVAALHALLEAVRTVEGAARNASAAVRRASLYLSQHIVWAVDGRQVAYVGPMGVPHRVIASAEDPAGQVALASFKRGDLAQPARYYLHQTLNKRLRGRVHLATVMEGRPGLEIYPESLLAAVYLHLALAAGAVTPTLRLCRNPRCPNGGFFFPRRRDQTACDKRCREMANYYERKARGDGSTQR